MSDFDLKALVEDSQRAFLAVADEARTTLIEICAFGTSESARISAAKEILERGLGKSSQSIEVTGKGGGPVEHSAVVTYQLPDNGRDR